MKSILILLSIIFSANALSQGPDYLKLEGELFIWGDHLPNKKGEDLDGLSVFITGSAAERLYKKMKSKPVYDGCYADGTYFKSQGMFTCSISPKAKYSCSFGISTKEGKLYGAESC